MQNMPDYAQLMRLAQSPEGQKLLNALRNADGAALSSAMNMAKNGDLRGAQNILAPLLDTPELWSLLEHSGRQ